MTHDPRTLAAVAHHRVWSRALLALSSAALLLSLCAESAAALSFAPARRFPAGPGPVALAVADLNGDGKLDLVVADGRGYSVRALIGNGRGGFAGTGPWATGAGPSSVAVADFNGDGKLDVVTGNGADGTVSVLFGSGLGGFVSRSDFIVGPPRLYAGLYSTGVAVGDFNGDGCTDIAVGDQPLDRYPLSEVAVLLGDGAGGFAPRYGVPTPEASRDIAVGDFNADGKQDLVAATVVVPEGDGTGAGVLLGDGAGGFARAPGGIAKVTDDKGAPSGVALGDLNGDGRQDVASALGTRALVLRGDGHGGLSRPVAFPVGAHPFDVAVGDFNRDGMLDLATADYAQNSVSVLLNGPRAAPVLRDLTPRQARIGTIVTLIGAHFGVKRGAGVVKFGAATAVSYVSWSSTKIKVKVPAGTARGWVKVTVRTVAGRSAAKSFRRL